MDGEESFNTQQPHMTQNFGHIPSRRIVALRFVRKGEQLSAQHRAVFQGMLDAFGVESTATIERNEIN